MLGELFSPPAGVFTGLLLLFSCLGFSFGLLDETDPELERWSVE